MPDGKSNWLERQTLAHNLGVSSHTMPEDIYVALFTTNPDEGDTGLEVDGGSYERKSATFSEPSTEANVTTTSNTSEIEWLNLPSVTVSHVGIYDAENGGNLLYYGELIEEREFLNGDNFKINTGQLVVRER